MSTRGVVAVTSIVLALLTIAERGAAPPATAAGGACAAGRQARPHRRGPRHPVPRQGLLAGRRAMRRHLLQDGHDLFGQRDQGQGREARPGRIRHHLQDRERDEPHRDGVLRGRGALPDRRSQDRARGGGADLRSGRERGGRPRKSIETGTQAAKGCAELYQTCRTAYPRLCTDTAVFDVRDLKPAVRPSRSGRPASSRRRGCGLPSWRPSGRRRRGAADTPACRP